MREWGFFLTSGDLPVRNICRGSNLTDSICNSKKAALLRTMIRKAATKLTNVNKAMPDADAAFAIGPLIGRVRTVMLSSLDGELQPFGITGMQFGILKSLADGSAETSADLSRL